MTSLVRLLLVFTLAFLLLDSLKFEVANIHRNRKTRFKSEKFYMQPLSSNHHIRDQMQQKFFAKSIALTSYLIISQVHGRLRNNAAFAVDYEYLTDAVVIGSGGKTGTLIIENLVRLHTCIYLHIFDFSHIHVNTLA